MALSNSVVWRVRAGGAQTNGGGYDATVSGAGTDYSDQDAPQLSITDLTSTASTTVTSVLSTFTPAMVGNILRIASGAGATTGYYMVTTYVSASQITLDRVSGTYTVGVAKIGGATDSVKTYSNGGSATAPTLTTPALPGHKVYIRGAGTDDPTTADYTISGYYTFPAGDTTSGGITLIGYNGRPMFSVNGLTFFSLVKWRLSGLKFKPTSNSNGNNGIANGALFVDNVYIDQNGQDTVGLSCVSCINSRFTNSGSSTAGTAVYAAIACGFFNGLTCGNFINGWRGDGIYSAGVMGTISGNIVTACKRNGIEIAGSDTYGCNVTGNTAHGNSGDGLYFTDANIIAASSAINNILTANGGYGINCVTGSATVNDKLLGARADYNNYGTGATANTSGARNNLSAGAHDVALDPQFVNAGADNYGIGANMKGIGFPGAFSTTASVSSVDLGAVQAAGGTAGMLFIPNMEGT